MSEKLLSISECPFCGHVFKDEDRRIIYNKIHEKDKTGEYILPKFRMICTCCDAGITLFRKTDYDPFEDM